MKLILRAVSVRVFGLLLLAFAFFPVDELTGKNLYVAGSGDNSNPGSLASPFLTINKGLAASQPGDTLFLRGGTYAETVDSNNVAIPSGTSFPKALTIQAYDSEIVVIRPESGEAAVNIDGEIHHTVWKDLIVDAVNVRFGVRLTDGAHHNRFENIEIKNAGSSGVLAAGASGGTGFNEFINCKSHDNGSSVMDHGIHLATSDNLIDGGEYYNNAGSGIHLYNDSSSVNRNLIREARAYNNGMHGIMITSGDANIAHHNVVCCNARGGIEVNWGTGSTNTKLYNNTVYNNRGEGIAIGSNNRNVTLKNNIVFLNAGAIVDYGSTGAVRSDNVTSDPEANPLKSRP